MIATMVDAHAPQTPDLDEAEDTYGTRLAHALKAAGLDYRAFAQRLGVTHMGIYKVLKGKSAYLQTPQHFAACKLLKIRPEWLALGEKPMRGEVAQSDAIDYRTLALMIIAEHPDTAARDLMLQLIELTDTKAAQLRQVAPPRVKAHTP